MSYKKQKNTQKQNNDGSKTLLEMSTGEIDEIRQKSIENIKKKKHEWRQKGPFIECQSCEYKHGYFIGINRVLIGINEDGSPIFEGRNKS